ncbi:MAG: hypothetical protein HXS47_09400 [Theionarchaea archaeon]|nr:hypothetical protein [Theionarchaea archaeon]
MKKFWFAGKVAVTLLMLYAIVLFLIIYEYPILGAVDSPTLTAGVPTFILFIWIVNTCYIIVTAIVVYWMFSNAKKIEWKATSQKEGA